MDWCKYEDLVVRNDRYIWVVAAVATAASATLCAGSGTGSQESTSKLKTREANELRKKALSRFHPLIGDWRGVGQPRRSSNRGAWTEKAEWIWAFQDGEPSLRCRTQKGKLLKEARLSWHPQAEHYLLDVVFVDNAKHRFTGQLKDRKLTLLSKPDQAGDTRRLTLTMLNEKRTLVLIEKQSRGRGPYARVAGIGYTRAGTSLAVAGVDGPECIVTGGKGTIPVKYNDKEYYVCCTGCRQVFDKDPTGTVADYLAQLAERKKPE